MPTGCQKYALCLPYAVGGLYYKISDLPDVCLVARLMQFDGVGFAIF